MFCMSRRSKLAEALAETCRGVGGGRGGRRAPCAYNGGGGRESKGIFLYFSNSVSKIYVGRAYIREGLICVRAYIRGTLMCGES